MPGFTNRPLQNCLPCYHADCFIRCSCESVGMIQRHDSASIGTGAEAKPLCGDIYGRPIKIKKNAPFPTKNHWVKRLSSKCTALINRFFKCKSVANTDIYPASIEGGVFDHRAQMRMAMAAKSDSDLTSSIADKPIADSKKPDNSVFTSNIIEHHKPINLCGFLWESLTGTGSEAFSSY